MMMKQTPHIAVVLSPGMGHIIPMLEFTKTLVRQKDLSVTLIVSDSGLHPNEQRPFLESLPQEISQVLLPRPNLDDLLPDQIHVMVHTIARSLSSLRDVIGSLAATSNLVALVVDFLGKAAFDVAHEFNIPSFLFIPFNAMFLSLLMCLPELDAAVSGPFQNLPGPLQLPGCIPLHAEDLLDQFEDRESASYKWLVDDSARYKMAAGIIINTFNGIEGETIKALQKENYPPIFPVGPLVRQADGTRTAGESRLMTMKWLDNQPQSSVLLLSFGSVTSLSQAQVHELAFGLELSEKRFLWVVRSPDKANPLSFLPRGFLERAKGLGLLVSGWAPQEEILSHGSIGGFLTHCGWNSVLESVVNGVPMIAWPLYAEQKMNAALLTERLKIAIRLRVREEDGLVGRVDIADSVKRLMEGEEGKRLRERSGALKGAGKMALDVAAGQSTKSLADFVSFLN